MHIKKQSSLFPQAGVTSHVSMVICRALRSRKMCSRGSLPSSSSPSPVLWQSTQSSGHALLSSSFQILSILTFESVLNVVRSQLVYQGPICTIPNPCLPSAGNTVFYPCTVPTQSICIYCQMFHQRLFSPIKEWLPYWWIPLGVDRGFCLTWSFSHSVPKKHTEVYINHKLVDLLAQASY